MSKEVLLSTRAQREFKKLPKNVRKRIRKVLFELAADKKRLDIEKLKGIDDREDLFRLRVGDYRVVFFPERTVIKVIRIQHRSKVYKWLE